MAEENNLLLKKIASIIILILFIPISVMAGSHFSLGFGSINQFQLSVASSETNVASIIDVHNWATGGELRSRIYGVNLDCYFLLQQGEIIDVTENGLPVFADNISQRIFGMVGIGFSTDVAAATTLSLSAGSLLGIDVSQSFDVRFWAGDRDNVCTKGNWSEFLSNIPLAYRLRLDFNLSRFSLGIHYQVPSLGFSYAQSSWSALEPEWNQGRLGASFITRIF